MSNEVSNNKPVLVRPDKHHRDLLPKLHALASHRRLSATTLAKQFLHEMVDPLYEALPDNCKLNIT